MPRKAKGEATAKERTTLMLATEVVHALDRLAGKRANRVAVVERAILELAVREDRRARDASDMQVLNQNAERLGREAEEVLAFQAGI